MGSNRLLERVENNASPRAGWQRHVLYVGEINDTQGTGVAAVDRGFVRMGAARPRTLSLFPQDRVEGCLADASVVGVRFVRNCVLRRPRQWGACWLALMLWRELQLDQFWSKRLGVSPQKGRIGISVLSCWSPTACWRRQRMAPAS